MSSVIEVNGLSKQYRIGTAERRPETFAGYVKNAILSPLTNYRKIRDLARKGGDDENVFWALKDISFNVAQGEVLAIIGKNGAGKSTLLKILSRITDPTQGEVKIKGRIAALLEVGTGFHPELSGRENVYMNGTILGMTRREINLKFDEIVEFSGVAKFIDTPVKFYSSGMKVRLGFAVAAHLDPEILIVDEVLSVGDAEFQRKAIGKMKDVTKGEGRTVLFVSHNMSSLRRLCSQSLLLVSGGIQFQGPIDEGISLYQKSDFSFMEDIKGEVQWTSDEAPGVDELRLLGIKMMDRNSEVRGGFLSNENIYCEVKYRILEETRNFRLNLQVHSNDDVVLFTITTHSIEEPVKRKGDYIVLFELPSNFFNQGRFKIFLQADIPTVKTFGLGLCFLSFDVNLNHSHGTTANDILKGYLSPQVKVSYGSKLKIS